MIFNPEDLKTDNVIIIKGDNGVGKTTLAKHLIERKGFTIQYHLGNLDYSNSKNIKKISKSIESKGGIFMQIGFEKGIGIIIDEIIPSIQKNILKELMKLANYATNKIMIIYIITKTDIVGIKKLIKKNTLVILKSPSEKQIKHIIETKESNKKKQKKKFKELKNIKDFRALYANLSTKLINGSGKRDKIINDNIYELALQNLTLKDEKISKAYPLSLLSLYLNNSYRLLPKNEDRQLMANIVSDTLKLNRNYCKGMCFPLLYNKKTAPKKLVKSNLLSYQSKFILQPF